MSRPAALCLFLATLVGCTPATPVPTLHALTGTLARGNRPVPAGGLIFQPVAGSGGLTHNASVSADGTFAAQTERVTALETRADPGIPAGTYKVTYHPPGDGQALGLEVELPDRVTVTAGGTTVELKLPAKVPAGVGAERDDANPPEVLDPKKD